MKHIIRLIKSAKAKVARLRSKRFRRFLLHFSRSKWSSEVIISGHLIGWGKKSKIMREFSGMLCGKMRWLCWEHAGLCGNLNNLEHWWLCLSNVLLLCELLSEDSSSSSSLWGQIYPYFKPQMILWEAERAKEDKVFKFLAQIVIKRSFLTTTAIHWNVNAFCPIEISVRTKLVPRLLAKRCV